MTKKNTTQIDRQKNSQELADIVNNAYNMYEKIKMENTKRTKHLVLSFNNNKIKSIQVYNPATTAAIFSVFDGERNLIFEKRIKKFGVDLFEDIFTIADLDFQSLVFESRTDDSSRILIDKIDSSTIFFEDSYGLEYGFKVNEEKCVLYDLQYNEHDFIKTNL